MQIKLLIVALIAVTLAAAVFYYQGLTPSDMSAAALTNAPAENATPFPDVAFTTPEGKAFHLTDLKEPVVLVHFWAAWCAVCHTEFPDLLAYVGNSDGKVALVAISLDDDYADSLKVLEKSAAITHQHLDAPHVYWAWDKDKNLSLHSFNTVKVPETIIVKNRLMVNKIIGVAPWKEATAQP